MGAKSININNIFKRKLKVYNYLQLNPETKDIVDYTIKYGLNDCKILVVGRKKFKPIFDDIFYLKWEQIIELQELVKDRNVFEVLKMIYKIDEKQFLKLNLYNCFSVYQFILSELQRMADIELQELSEEQKNAGQEQLNRFGYYNNLDFLAKGDILKYDELLKKPYAVIFRKLVLEKVKYDIEKNYIKNVSRKIKGN